MTEIFDRQIPHSGLGEAYEEALNGRELHVCTVRQTPKNDVALGNLFWMVQAFKALKNGSSKIVVNDFYDPGKDGEESGGIAEIIQALQVEGADVDFVRADEVVRDPEVWRRFVDYVREHPGDREISARIAEFQEGIDKVLGANGYEVPEFMDRFLEELCVWVRSIDGGAVQLLNHEVETTAWVRKLYPDADKEFWCVGMPYKNEYRGRIGTVGDLPQRLAYGEDWQGYPDREAAQRADAFNRQLFDDLIEVLKFSFSKTEVSQKCLNGDFGNPSDSSYDSQEEHRYYESGYVVEKLFEINPGLVSVYCLELDEERMKAVYSFINMCVHEKDPEDREAFFRPMFESITAIARAELLEDKPSLRDLSGFSKILGEMRKNHLVDRKDFNSFFGGLFTNKRFADEEVARFWLKFVPNMSGDDFEIFSNPVVDRIAASADIPDELWGELRDFYVNGLRGSKWYEHGHNDFRSIPDNCEKLPVVQRIIEELLEIDPDAFVSIVNTRCSNYFRRNNSCEWKPDLGMLGFVEYIFELCEERGLSMPQKDWYNRMKDILGRARAKTPAAFKQDLRIQQAERREYWEDDEESEEEDSDADDWDEIDEEFSDWDEV